MSKIHVFGIRHHGPGSARSLLKALNELEPDAILVEGPAGTEPLLPLIVQVGMQPPVALLTYQVDQPRNAGYYPFAVFSPEWQAIRYGLESGKTVRFIDLPPTHMLALRHEEPGLAVSNEPTDTDLMLRLDPLGWLAKAAGFESGEQWWDRMVEQRRDSQDVFHAILEAMTALRDQAGELMPILEAQREAHMRKLIRKAVEEGFDRIAVVCGAWHTPALAVGMPARADKALLKDLPAVKVKSTWVPWTYERLDRRMGYGAGVVSPGWYDHLWHHPEDAVTTWASRSAAVLRRHDLPASTAQIIDAVRLADSLAAIRGYASPGLDELVEAIRATMCNGSDVPLSIVHRDLIVGKVMGTVPPETPQVPLQQDLAAQQKRLRLKVDTDAYQLELDLRTESHLNTSYLLHRLSLLNIPWGKKQPAGRNRKGTFHEVWQVQWAPELVLNLIEASAWGNTVYDAATAFVIEQAGSQRPLPELTPLVDDVLLAALPDAIEPLMAAIRNASALTGDVTLLMEALPPLVKAMRYGSVRQTDTTMVAGVIDSLIARMCIGLPAACSSLNDDAAASMLELIIKVNAALGLLQNPDHLATWHKTLAAIIGQERIHRQISGRGYRILYDARLISDEDLLRRMQLELSAGEDPLKAAAWLDGFLTGSGLVLIHDRPLWQTVDDWLCGLSREHFEFLMPLLRRTFSTFEGHDRQQMGEIVAHNGKEALLAGEYDRERAQRVIPVLALLLGAET